MSPLSPSEDLRVRLSEVTVLLERTLFSAVIIPGSDNYRCLLECALVLPQRNEAESGETTRASADKEEHRHTLNRKKNKWFGNN